ncbi:MAG TPA: extracellular solute-binding protein, partial [Candidatus Eisenbacteria bacterium]|nr:extracellular solute-binding protein [Candidatus Eisenbacteria bacterium]
MRRRAMLLAAALGLAALACGPGSDARTIVFWQFWSPDVVQPLLAQFEKEHPGWKVEMEQLTWQSGLEKITAAVASGKVPDLCELGSTWMPRMLSAGQLTDWSGGVADLREQLRGWELCAQGGKVYGVPWVMGTRALFYNKTLFARAGLDSTRPPETWEELEQAAAAIQRLGGDVRGYGVQAGERYVLFKKFMPYAWGNGGRILSDDLTKAEFDSPQNLAALEFYLSLRRVGMMERQNLLDRAFKEGKLGLQISGAWLFKSIPRDAPKLHYGVALVPRPERDRGFHASFAGGEVLVSFTAAKRKDGALELARFLVRPENALALAASAQSVQPATVGAETSAYYRERPNEQLMIRQFETAVPAPNHPRWVDLETTIEDEVEQALHDRKTAAQAIAAAQHGKHVLLDKPMA